MEDTKVKEENVEKNSEQISDAAEIEKETEFQKELDALKDKYVRLGADYQNYKKRVELQRAEWAFSAQSKIILELLPVIDNFDRALEEAQKNNENQDLKKWLAGFELIHKNLYDCLKSCNVTEIDQVTTFDPELHEALMQVEDEKYESGQIVQVLQKGFMLDSKVIRPAKVSVAK